MSLDRIRVVLTLTTLCALACSASAGCTTGRSSGGARGAALVVRSAAGCAGGCALDRPLLVGSELIAEVLAPVDLDDLEVRALDPATATAWVESVRLCCESGPGGTCRRMQGAELECGGRMTTQPRVVLRALAAGETAIEILADESSLGVVPLRVEDAVAVNLVPTTTVLGESPDLLAREVPPEAWIDGRLDAIELHAGSATRVWIVAIGPGGQQLLDGEGAGARIADEMVAAIGPASGVCRGTVAEGAHIEIHGVAPGTTAIELRAGSAQRVLPVTVAGSCEPLGRLEPTEVPCQSDADCVPAECCHAATCTSVAQAPDCEDVACTLECRAGTLDCGGRCLCLEGRCTAYIPALPDPECARPGAGPEIDLPPIEPPF